jgi:hypothetical protein
MKITGNNIFRYRYAAFKHPELMDNPLLNGKCFPILEFKLRNSKIKEVKLLIQEDPKIVDWFHWKLVTLYKGPQHFAKAASGLRTHNLFSRLKKRFNLK